MTPSKRSLIPLGAVGLSATFLLTGCRESPPAEVAVRPVRAIRIGDAPALSGRTFSGAISAVEAVDLSFRVGGPIIAFPGNELGKSFAKGDLVAQIDPRDFQVRLRDAEASLARAKAELDAMRKARPEEIEKLKAEVQRAEAASQFAHAELNRYLKVQQDSPRSVTQSEVELAQAKAKLADAEALQAEESLRIGEEGARPEDIRAKESAIESLSAAVQSSKDELADAQLLAPFGGAVAATYVDNFEVVQPRQRVVRLVNSSEFEIRVDVPENLIALVPQVEEAFVVVQSFPEREIPARIAEVGTEASPSTRTYPVKLRFQPPSDLDVRAGMSGTVKGRASAVETAATSEHVIPTTAVFERDGQQRVWIVDPEAKTVTSREVEVATTTTYGISIKGVTPGEYVVTAGSHFLQENQKVKLATDDAGGDAL